MVGAVFLDRDGVINENVFYRDTGEVEAPRTLADYRILPGALEAMRRLQHANFLLFLVSNQPNQAKRKATQADHEAIHSHLMQVLDRASITLTEAFYCFHHPNAFENALRMPCVCRKPSPYFLLLAARKYALNMGCSWMVGDRDTDILCGHEAHVRTIRISNLNEENQIDADFRVSDLAGAARIIIGQ